MRKKSNLLLMVKLLIGVFISEMLAISFWSYSNILINPFILVAIMCPMLYYLVIKPNNKINDQIIFNAYHDSLTKLYNRSYCEEELKRINVLRNYPISILMIDVDKLKIINDTFGHSKGDKLLIYASESITSSIRGDDMVARMGGDEFIVTLKNTNHKRAYELAMEIQRKFKACIDLDKISLSLSIGISTVSTFVPNLEVSLQEADEDLYNNKMLSSSTVQNDLVMSLSNIMQFKDIHTQAHGYRIKDIALEFGKDIGLINGQLRDLQLLATFHDIGKIGIPDKILNKPGKLNPEEWKIMQTHCEIGYRILGNARQFLTVSQYVLHHHENWDGSGYPYSLKGKKIPLHSRIIRILDTYDTIISERPYQKSRTSLEAIKELQKYSGVQFDPRLVNKFVDFISAKMIKAKLEKDKLDKS